MFLQRAEKRVFKITGTGVYRPENKISSLSLDAKLGKRPGWVEKKSGVVSRRYVEAHDTTASMGAKAARLALASAGLSKIGPGDIDCIISAAGTTQQAIPCTAVFIQHELGLAHLAIPCFDVNSTCLSFLTALDTASALLAVGRFKRILIVSSEIPSLGLNWEHMESSLIFGDGAAAMVVEAAAAGEEGSVRVLSSHMETYADSAHVCQVQAGGTRFHPTKEIGDLKQLALFEMDGKKAFKVTSQKIDAFLEALLIGTDMNIRDMDVVIPHQASQLALDHIRKKLKIPHEKFINIFADHGNQVAASIPTAIHRARVESRINSGSRALVIGTGAGISLAAMVLEFQ